ncbi:MAG: HAD family hydrolase [Acidimicrobiia bacterium]|nr:HAD family hydrolase [Acidimicrobiia bacterium]
METTAKAAAFFDLDRTLISGSSLYVFGMAAWRNDMVETRQVLKDLTDAVVFRFAGASDEKTEAIKNRVLDAIAGVAVADLKGLGGDILPKLLESVRLESQGLLDLHHQAGRDTYIVSASPIEIVEGLAEALGMTGAIGTVAEIVDGRYTGLLAEPFCYGQGKADAISKLASAREYDLRLSYAYTDSMGDLPMLEIVGHPVAVNPDRALESLAYHQGWPVVEFSRKRKEVVARTTAAAGALALAGTTYALGRRHGRLLSG